ADRDVARPMFARDARSGEADESAFKSSVGADDAIVGAKGGEKNEMPAPKPEAKLEYRGAIGRFAKVPAEKSGTRAEFATGGETGGSSGAGKGIDTLGGVAAPTASVEAPEQSVEGKAQTADVPAQEMKDEESARSVAARKADAPTTAQPPPAPAKSAPAGPPAAASDNGWRQDGAVREKERDEAGVASPSGEAEQSPATRGEIGRRFDGRNSGLTRGDMRVVRQDAAFDELWTRLWATRAQPPPRPAIDFARQVVVTVALGTQPTGGHGVRIESVRLAGSVLTVVVLETHPRPGAVVTQSMTQPFSVVVVEFDGRIPEDLEVRFDRRVTEGDLP
ncbi:protease complex subunit PrcB family protein, partial [bacterium]|nr:protease complex subunit PrcB family protein [bacterium]